MVLTISPLVSLYEYFLSRRTCGDRSGHRRLRFHIKGARGLQRPRCELDFLPQEQIDSLVEEEIQSRWAPTTFAVISVNEREQYTTFEKRNDHNPNWDESFDISVDNRSTVEIRIYDGKCIDRGWPAFIGSTTILPFSVLPLPKDSDPEPDPEALVKTKVHLDDIALVRGGVIDSKMTVSISLSADTRFQPSLPYVPPLLSGPQAEHVQTRIELVKWRDKKYGRKKQTTTRVYQL